MGQRWEKEQRPTHLAQLGSSCRIERLVDGARDGDAEDSDGHPSPVLPTNSLFHLDVQDEFLRVRVGSAARSSALGALLDSR